MWKFIFYFFIWMLTVNAEAAPVISFRASGGPYTNKTTMMLVPGDLVTYNWSVSGAVSISTSLSIYGVGGAATGSDSCGNRNGPWVISTANGSGMAGQISNAQLLPCQLNNNYWMTLTAVAPDGSVSSASISITVVPIQTNFTINGMHAGEYLDTGHILVVNPGTVLNYAWSSTSVVPGVTITNRYVGLTVSNASGANLTDACGNTSTSVWTPLAGMSGTLSAQVAACQAGYDYLISIGIQTNTGTIWTKFITVSVTGTPGGGSGNITQVFGAIPSSGAGTGAPLWPIYFRDTRLASPASEIVANCSVSSTGIHNTVGTSNGDTRFMCFNNRWYDCGWENNDPSWETKIADGGYVGSYYCNLAAAQWVPLDGVQGTQDCSIASVGSHNTLGTANGDTRFLCFNARWYDCGWENTDPNWETKVSNGKIVGSYKCDLPSARWVQSSTNLGTTNCTANGLHNVIGYANGDPRFICFNNRWYDCGWEATDPNWETKAPNGRIVGSYKCDLSIARWTPLAGSLGTKNCENGGTHGALGTSNGDPRFLCLNNRWYDCGWELNDPSWETKVGNGKFVGGFTCNQPGTWSVTPGSPGHLACQTPWPSNPAWTRPHNTVNPVDTRFYCFSGRWYECLWEGNDPSWETKVAVGKKVGSYTCNSGNGWSP